MLPTTSLQRASYYLNAYHRLTDNKARWIKEAKDEGDFNKALEIQYKTEYSPSYALACCQIESCSDIRQRVEMLTQDKPVETLTGVIYAVDLLLTILEDGTPEMVENGTNQLLKIVEQIEELEQIAFEARMEAEEAVAA